MRMEISSRLKLRNAVKIAGIVQVSIASFKKEVIFYWRALKAGEYRTIRIGLITDIPGTYTGPVSRAYLYYTDEDKHWVEVVGLLCGLVDGMRCLGFIGHCDGVGMFVDLGKS